MAMIMGLSRRRTLQLAAAATFAPFGRPALADTYPSRVVRLFVGFPPGGGADLATRIVANGLSELWHQQVIVENRPGAGARIALDTVAHAPADGYAMLLTPLIAAGSAAVVFHTDLRPRSRLGAGFAHRHVSQHHRRS